MFIIFQLIVFIFSVIIHEVSHGLVALKLGDTTAKDAGRLTLNPLVHLEFFGSFLLPLMLYIVSGGAFVFGWAKPVPYNPYNLRHPRRSAGLIAAGGPLSNLIVAVVFGILIRLGANSILNTAFEPLLLMLHVIVFVNILLAVFNLVPLPPLDGSKILYALLPVRYDFIRVFLERYGLMLLVLFITFGYGLLLPIMFILYRAIVGGVGIL